MTSASRWSTPTPSTPGFVRLSVMRPSAAYALCALCVYHYLCHPRPLCGQATRHPPPVPLAVDPRGRGLHKRENKNLPPQPPFSGWRCERFGHPTHRAPSCSPNNNCSTPTSAQRLVSTAFPPLSLASAPSSRPTGFGVRDRRLAVRAPDLK